MHAGYSAAFLALSAVAAVGFILYLFAMAAIRDHITAPYKSASASAAAGAPQDARRMRG